MGHKHRGAEDTHLVRKIHSLHVRRLVDSSLVVKLLRIANKHLLAENDLRLLGTEWALILVVLRRVEIGLYIEGRDPFCIHRLFIHHDLCTKGQNVNQKSANLLVKRRPQWPQSI